MFQGGRVYWFAGAECYLREVIDCLDGYSVRDLEKLVQQGVFEKPLLTDLREYFITRCLFAVANKKSTPNG